MTIESKLHKFFGLENEIFEYFGYKEDWKKIPLVDHRDYYWQLDQEENGTGVVNFNDTLPTTNEDGDLNFTYSDTIYTQRFLPKWVYRTDKYTMISVDTECDGNKYLAIFDNEKEVKIE